MSQDSRAVNADPIKGCEGEFVDVVPGQLLGEEIIATGKLEDLR